MKGRAAAWQRGLVLGLWLVSGLLALLLPPRPEVPPCCRVDGAHQCSMRHPLGGGKTPAAALKASCAFNSSVNATGARLTALQPSPPSVRTRDAAARKASTLPSEVEPAEIIIRRASRAPPRLLV